MENASKALLIAAAILIAIILISLGLIAINQGREVIDEAGSGVADVAVSTFNSKFTAYFGTNKSGADARALIQAVRTNNKVNSDDPSKIINICVGDSSKNTDVTDSGVVLTGIIGAGNSYTIDAADATIGGKSCEDYTTGGYVHTIVITETTR